MSIKRKLIIFFLVVIVVVIISASLGFGAFFHNHIIKQESQQINTIIAGISTYFNSKTDNYISTVNDWGHWDATQLFIDSKNPEYIDENIMESTFSILDITFIIIINNEDEILCSKYYSVEDNKFIEFPSGFMDCYNEITLFAKSAADNNGIMQIGNNYYIVASSGVTDSRKTLPANGKLIIGKKIDNEIISDIEELTACKVSSISSKENTDVSNQPLMPIIFSGKSYYEKDLVLLELAIADSLEARDLILVNLLMPRSLNTVAKNDFRIFSIIYTIVIGILGIIVLYILYRTIMMPVKKLMCAVESIDENEFSRIEESGEKEFLPLRKVLNALMSRLEASQKELKKQKDELKATLVSVGEGVISLNNSGIITFMNPVAEKLTGWDIEDAIDLPIEAVFNTISEYTKVPLENQLKKPLETKENVELINDILLVSKNGRERPIEIIASPITDEEGAISGCVIIFRDVSERKQSLQQIMYLSYHDQLTGLFNRRFYEKALSRVDVKGNLPLSVIYADINGLKIINDAFGHESGDQIIKKTADMIKLKCPEEGIIVRAGGDEFLILLPNMDELSVVSLIDIIKASVSQIKVHDISTSLTLGWATKTEESQNIFDLLHEAEDRMYEKKILNSNTKRNGIIKSILNTLLIMCPLEEAHSTRVSNICMEIGKAFRLSADDINELAIAGELHDIGKISVDKTILNKPGKLTETEWFQMKQHSENGYRLLGATSEFFNIAEFVYAHHERWDGKGYPKGLKEKDIPWKSRVIAIADAFDAMVSERPYKNPLNFDDAIEEIRKGAGTQFDPEIAKVFIEQVAMRDL